MVVTGIKPDHFWGSEPVHSFNQEIKAQQIIEDSEGEKMEKVLKIKGMMCNNCKAHVEKALNSLEGVSVQVDLEDGSARVSLSKAVSDETLKQVIAEAGYEVTSISAQA